MRAYLEDIKNGRGADARDLLTGPARTQAGHGDPAARAGVVLLTRGVLGASAIDQLEAKVAQLPISVSGNRATAPALTESGTTNFVYTAGRWLIGTNY
jgi:hypothetical protein